MIVCEREQNKGKHLTAEESRQKLRGERMEITIHTYKDGRICTNEKVFDDRETLVFSGTVEILTETALLCIEHYQNLNDVRTGLTILRYLLDKGYLVKKSNL
jgi:hypothetical protein